MNEKNFYKYGGTYYQPGDVKIDYREQLYSIQKRNDEKNKIITAGIAIGTAIIASLVIQLFALSILNTLGLYDLFKSSVIFQNCVNIIIVDFLGLIIPFGLLSLVLRDRYITPVIPHTPVGKLKAAAWVSVGMGVCVGANYCTSYIKSIFYIFGYELKQTEDLKPDSIFACIIIVFSTAIAPAVCEEFALRCCTLGVLRRHGKAFAVVAVSIVFGLLHGNLIQFIFAFIVGLILGYITVVTDSVIPAMLIHGFNNGVSVTSDIFEYAIGEKASNTAIKFLFIMWGVLCLIGFVYLAAKKSLVPKRTPQEKTEQSSLPFGSKLLCLLPGLFIPMLILIILTMNSIVPIS